MTDTRLPDALRAAIEVATADRGRGLTGRAGELSEAYRSMRSSATAVVDRADIAAYLLTRLPATYAAATRVLEEVVARLPAFAPKSLLDAGAGPGTASWAVTQAFPMVEAMTMLDRNGGLLSVAGELAAGSSSAALSQAERISGSLRTPPVGGRRFDLVIAGYALTELADAEVVPATLGLWQSCSGALVIIEPGRPRDYRRLMDARGALLEAGAQIVAPCPHAAACPLPDGDWCHFSVRLQRSRAHMQAKGGSLGYEDEKFSYLVVARPELAPAGPEARVLRQPVARKFGVELALCSAAGGLDDRTVARRDAAAFKQARKLEWGDAIG